MSADASPRKPTTENDHTSVKLGATGIEIFLRVRPPAPGVIPALLIDPVEAVVTFPGLASAGDASDENAGPSAPGHAAASHAFKFHGVLGPGATQEETYDRVAAPAVAAALAGVHGTVFAYGQTGSGKTHTVTGAGDAYADRGILPRALSALYRGAAQRTDLRFDFRAGRQWGPARRARSPTRWARRADGALDPDPSPLSPPFPQVSYLELYNERAYDLLAPGREVGGMEDLPRVDVLVAGGGPGPGYHAPGLTGATSSRRRGAAGRSGGMAGDEDDENGDSDDDGSVEGSETAGAGASPARLARRASAPEASDGEVVYRGLSCPIAATEAEALGHLFVGDVNRSVASTAMNLASSRSHCLFTVHIEQRPAAGGAAMSGGRVVKSRLCLVDLAGSERVSKTRAEGRALREAGYINGSLFYLEQVILALQRGGGHHSGGRRGPPRHVPYRNCLLTTCLRDALGGNCRTAMIATVHAGRNQRDESVSTCRFAQRVAAVKNVVRRNEEADPAALVAGLRRRVRELEAECRLLRSVGGGGGGGASSTVGLTAEERNHARNAALGWCDRPASRDDDDDDEPPLLGGSVPFLQEAMRALRERARGGAGAETSGGGGGPGGGGTGGDPGVGAAAGADVDGAPNPHHSAEEGRLRRLLRERDAEITVLVRMLADAGLAGSDAPAPSAASAAAGARSPGRRRGGGGGAPPPPPPPPPLPPWILPPPASSPRRWEPLPTPGNARPSRPPWRPSARPTPPPPAPPATMPPFGASSRRPRLPDAPSPRRGRALLRLERGSRL